MAERNEREEWGKRNKYEVGIPFALDFGDGADVRFGCEHEFVVEDPFGLFVHAR